MNVSASPDDSDQLGSPSCEEEDDDQEEEEEDEPVLKYERIGNNLNEALAKDAASCMAVNDKFIALGTHFGMVHVVDHQGNIVKEFNPHSTTVNEISLDENGDYLASCSDDGRVVIIGLYSNVDDQVQSYDCPIKAVALDSRTRPNSGKTYLVGLGDRLILNEKTWLGRMKSTTLHSSEGPICAIAWRGSFIAFANDVGVKVYDQSARQLISFIKKDKPGLRSEAYRCNLCWKDDVTLLIGWGNVVKICIVKDRASSVLRKNPIAEEVVPSRFCEIVSMFATEYYISGIAPKDSALVLLAFLEDGPRLEDELYGSRRPQLRIVQPRVSDCEDLVTDALTVTDFGKYRCSEYRLACLPGDGFYFILSPKDLIFAHPRDTDDRIEWLIRSSRFEEALAIAQNQSAMLRRYTLVEVGRCYINYLLSEARFDEAAAKLADILGIDKESWETEVYRFSKLKKLAVISGHVPTTQPRLSPVVYELILNDFLRSDVAQFQWLIKRWPCDLYDLHTIINAVDEQLMTVTDADRSMLLECLGKLYYYDGRYERALRVYLQLKHPDVFAIIREHNLFSSIHDKVVLLMEFNIEEALNLLLNNLTDISVAEVMGQLKKHRRYQYLYLDALFRRDKSAGRNFHNNQVRLYSEFDRERLLPFLKNSDYLAFSDALTLCQDLDFAEETVFLLGKIGNFKEALRLIIEKLKDVDKAIEFAKEVQDDDLWNDLIKYSMDKPKFITSLLQNSGTHINPIRIIDRIPRTLEIPDLQSSLVKILHDYNLQVSLRDGCGKILVSDCYSLFVNLYKAVRQGQTLSSQCLVCMLPIPGDSGSGVITFNCRHCFHEECVPGGVSGFFCNICCTKRQKERAPSLH